MGLDIAQYFSNITIRKGEPIKFIGTENLVAVMREQVADLQDLLNVAREREYTVAALNDSETLEDAAATYDNPKLLEVGIPFKGITTNRRGSQSGTRRIDTTTFNVCGLCRYAIGDSLREYSVKGKCNLFPQSINDEVRSIAFDTPCRLRSNPTIIDECREEQKRVLGSIYARIEKAKEAICLLGEAIAASERRPVLPRYRSSSWITGGDEIVSISITDLKLEWAVVDYYDDREEKIVFRDHNIFHRATTLDNPWIIKKEELEFLRNDRDYLEFWAINAGAPAMREAITSS